MRRELYVYVQKLYVDVHIKILNIHLIHVVSIKISNTARFPFFFLSI